MNRNFKLALFLLFITVGCYFIWWHLPVTINRHSDLILGNRIIENFDKYLIQNHNLPKENDWKTLSHLGFVSKNEIVSPELKILSKTEYELYFIDGFDLPYLMWNSLNKDGKWVFPVTTSGSNNSIVANKIKNN